MSLSQRRLFDRNRDDCAISAFLYTLLYSGAVVCLSELLHGLHSTYHMSTLENTSLRYCAGCRRNRFITEFSRRRPNGPYMKTCDLCLNWRRTNRSKSRHRPNRRARRRDIANIARFPSLTSIRHMPHNSLVAQPQDTELPDPIGWLPREGPARVLYYSHGSMSRECTYCNGLHWLHEKITVRASLSRLLLGSADSYAAFFSNESYLHHLLFPRRSDAPPFHPAATVS